MNNIVFKIIGSLEDCKNFEKEKLNDPRYAFIKWKTGKIEQCNVVSMNDVDKKETFELNDEIKVKWGGSKHAAILLFIGILFMHYNIQINLFINKKSIF